MGNRRELLALPLMFIGSIAFGQVDSVETRNGVRQIIYGENRTEIRSRILERVQELGYDTWALPQSTSIDIPASRPRKVADCPNTPAEYVAAHDIPATIQGDERRIITGNAQLYDFQAYANALSNGDCTCGSLVGDWERAVTDFSTIRAGIEPSGVWIVFTVWSQKLIKDDYDRMCDVTMTLDLE